MSLRWLGRILYLVTCPVCCFHMFSWCSLGLGILDPFSLGQILWFNFETRPSLNSNYQRLDPLHSGCMIFWMNTYHEPLSNLSWPWLHSGLGIVVCSVSYAIRWASFFFRCYFPAVSSSTAALIYSCDFLESAGVLCFANAAKNFKGLK